MNQLNVINQNGQLLVDSREVAEATSVRHADLLEKISGYVQHLTNGSFRSSDFFIENTYVDGKGETRPCYLLTRKGCDMVANKMTGEKGVLFTAAYVTRFEEMEKQLSKPQQLTATELIAAMANQAVELERRQADQAERISVVEKKLDDTAEILSLNAVDGRKKVTALLNKIAQTLGGGSSYQDIRSDSYQRLESRAECNLSIRQTNKRKKMALEGVVRSKIDKVSKLDVIFDDGRLTEIYFAIVKEMAIQNKISLEEAV